MCYFLTCLPILKVKLYQYLLFKSLVVATPVFANPEFISINEVQPGMQGEWHTVVTGTDIESFPLEVLGVARNLMGPQRDVIMCKALDDLNQHSGPVAGMSGSPVYINGKLAGAYAFGFPWQKDQAIIGVTPIADMLPVADESLVQDALPRKGVAPVTWLGEDKAVDSPARQSQQFHLDALRPAPLSLMMGGFSTSTLEHFSTELEALNVIPAQAPTGSSQNSEKFELVPGAPIAAVLMSGDFSASAVGTVTWRDDERLLGFGHPFFKLGQTEVPMAGAEVITVINSLQRSFKLSATGPVVGTIYQDRVTGVAGKLGEAPPMIDLTIRLRSRGGDVRELNGQLFKHPQFTPLFAGMSLFEALLSGIESSTEQTFFLNTRIHTDELPTIELSQSASGPTSAVSLASDFLQRFRNFMVNPFEEPGVQRLEFDVEIEDRWQLSGLQSIQIEQTVIRPGDTVTLNITSLNYQNDLTTHRISVPIPASLKKGQNLVLFVGDAGSADSIDGIQNIPPSSLIDLADSWEGLRDKRNMYVKLLKPAEGLRMNGQSMHDLPPSIQQMLNAPANIIRREPLSETTIWETQQETNGEFQGSARLTFTLD